MERIPPEVLVSENREQLAGLSAQFFADLAQAFAVTSGCFSIALAGGETPRMFYETLAEHPYRDEVPWDLVVFYWGDERCVPPDHPDSNYRMAEEALLSRVPIPRENIHRIHAENPDPEQAAREYEQLLRTGMGDQPEFDLVLLGLGKDGHTASLFPENPVLHETSRLVAAPYVEKFHSHRITLTLPVINNASMVLFMVSGKEKAGAVQQVLEGEYRPDQLPAQLIQPRDRLLWLIDEGAASLLEGSMESVRPR